MKGIQWLFLGVLLNSFFTYSCENKTATAVPCQSFCFLGHPYDWYTENALDPRLELMDFSQFTGIWLGGDVCGRTSKSATTLVHLDAVFGLKKATTHWAWGNHDLLEGNEQLLLAATGRPDYYTVNQDGLQVIVLNTNLFWYNAWSPPREACERKLRQVQWLRTVLDSIHSAQQVVVLHHHGLLNELKTNAQGDTIMLDNIAGIPVRTDCEENSDFSRDLYPLLVRLRQRGIPVTLVAGDVGMNSKGYQIMTPDSIQLLGSGINNSLDMIDPADYVTNLNPDSLLLFEYCPANGKMNWHFVRLSEMLEAQLEKKPEKQISERVRVLLDQF